MEIIFSISIIALAGVVIYDIVRDLHKKQVAEVRSDKKRCEHCLFANREQTYCYRQSKRICYYDQACEQYMDAQRTIANDYHCNKDLCSYYQEGLCQYCGNIPPCQQKGAEE